MQTLKTPGSLGDPALNSDVSSEFGALDMRGINRRAFEHAGGLSADRTTTSVGLIVEHSP